MKKIVVTGALGHIGSSLVRKMPEWVGGGEIVLADNLLTQRYCSLFDLPESGRYRFVPADILTADLDSLFRDADVVVHLAAITDAANSFGNEDQVEKVNFDGTVRVAEACIRTGARLISLSTTSVYGTQAKLVDENCSPEELQPQSPYAKSKFAAEEKLKAMRAQGLRHVSLRFGTIFGISPGMRFHTAINKFSYQAALGEPVTVWRTALHQLRPYLDLEDGVRAIEHVVRKDLFDGGVYNVLTLNASVNDIVTEIKAHIPDLEIKFVDNQIMNQLSYEVGNRKFAATGFEVRGNLAEGIRRTVLRLKGIRSAKETK